jgi:asparagine synthetase B (glutamine-hydrolysing)
LPERPDVGADLGSALSAQRQPDGSWLLRPAALADGSVCWRHDGQSLRFARQPADLAGIAPSASIDWDVLRGLLALEFPTGAGTPFLEVHRLPAGMECQVEPDGSVSQLHRTWTPAPEPSDSTKTPDLWTALVAQCVSSMRGARRTAVMLSGGLDSSVVAAAAVAAARQLGQPIPILLSATYPGLDCDEAPEQQLVARHLSAPHRTVNACDTPLWPAIRDAAREQLHPLVDGQEGINVALYRIAQAEECDLVLTGVGGDELFEGRGAEIDLVRRGKWHDAFRLIRSTERARPQSLMKAFFRRGLRLPVQPTRTGLTWPDRRAAGSWCRAVLRQTLASPGLSWRLEMAGRTARRAGLRLESPLLGNHFLGVFEQVPLQHLLKGGAVKGLLREVATPWLPEHVVRRVAKARFTAYYNFRLPFDAPVLAAEYLGLRAQSPIAWLPNDLKALFETPIVPARFLTGWIALGILQFADAWSADTRRM